VVGDGHDSIPGQRSSIVLLAALTALLAVLEPLVEVLANFEKKRCESLP
jgi:hypothetical protein